MDRDVIPVNLIGGHEIAVGRDAELGKLPLLDTTKKLPSNFGFFNLGHVYAFGHVPWDLVEQFFENLPERVGLKSWRLPFPILHAHHGLCAEEESATLLGWQDVIQGLPVVIYDQFKAYLLSATFVDRHAVKPEYARVLMGPLLYQPTAKLAVMCDVFYVTTNLRSWYLTCSTNGVRFTRTGSRTEIRAEASAYFSVNS